MFIWRACNNILLTKANLKKKNVLDDDKCNFCCGEPETTLHILWDCPSSQDVWCGSGNKIQKRGVGGMNFMAVMKSMVELLQEEELELFVLTAKGIWKRRNDTVHGEILTHPNVILKKGL